MSKEIAKFDGKTDIAARKGRVGQGSQNVTANDLAIPRIKLLQKISKEVDKTESKYIEGAEAGMFMNSVNHELSTTLYVINLHFDHKVVVWKKLKHGGGMYGAFDTAEEAEAKLEADGEPLAQYDISENPTHLTLVLDPSTGKPKGIALFDMPGSKRKVSRQWNTLIQEEEDKGNPRFGCVWELSAVVENGNEGPYFNVGVRKVAQAPDEIYQHAGAAYDRFFSPAEEDLDEAA